MQRALTLAIEIEGEDHPMTAACMHALVLWKQTDGTDDRKDEAELVVANVDCRLGKLDAARRRYQDLRSAAGHKAYGGQRRSDDVVRDEVACELEKGSRRRAVHLLAATLAAPLGMAPLARAHEAVVGGRVWLRRSRARCWPRRA